MQYNYRNVTFRGGFWRQMEELNSKVTINAVYDRFYETGRIDAFKFEWKEGEYRVSWGKCIKNSP